MSTGGVINGPLKCPACGYPLVNLPAWHVCPECGVPYDPYSKVHNVNVVGEHIVGMVNTIWPVFLAAVVFLPVVVTFTSVTFGERVFYACILVFALRFVFEVYGLVRDLGGQCRVLISHQGIRFEYPHAAPLYLNWRDFGSAHFGIIIGRLRVWDRDGRQLLRHRDRTIGSTRLRRKLATELNELAKLYTTGQLTCWGESDAEKR